MLRIGLDPSLFRIGGLEVTWHSLFTVVGVWVAVWLALRWAPLKGLRREDVEGTAFWGILGVAYEMLWDLLIFGLVRFALPRPFRAGPAEGPAVASSSRRRGNSPRVGAGISPAGTPVWGAGPASPGT